VDADSKPHLLTGRAIRILLGYGVLHRDRTLHGIDSAGEIGDEAIARCVEDPASVRGYQGIDDAPVGRERAKGSYLVQPHQAAVAFDIGCEDRGKLPFDGARFQGLGTSPIDYSPIRQRSEDV